MLYVILRILITLPMLLLLRPAVYGKQNLRVKGKAIFVCNHINYLDPVLLALISPRVIRFMAKAELFETPLNRLLMKGLLAFPVNRKSADLTSLRTAIKVLNEDKVFGIFPEGKRAVTDELDEFEKGAAFLAARTGSPVVPIYLHPNSWRTLHPKIIVGKPVNVSAIVAEADQKSLLDVVTDAIANAMVAIKAELENIVEHHRR